MAGFRALAAIGLTAAALAVAGCEIMPANGPAGMDVHAAQKDRRSLPYALVKITPQVETVLAENTPRLGATFKDRRPPKGIVLGIGDVVAVTVFEAAAGGSSSRLKRAFAPATLSLCPIRPSITTAIFRCPMQARFAQPG